jgi:hypothetical protein
MMSRPAWIAAYDTATAVPKPDEAAPESVASRIGPITLDGRLKCEQVPLKLGDDTQESKLAAT